MKYTTWGPVRMGCNHNHHTWESALRCLKGDTRGCSRVGGYSDRTIRKVPDGEKVTAFNHGKGPGEVISCFLPS